MAIFHGSAIPASGEAAYTIDQSLRFEDGSSAYLSRTPASAGNRRTWTFSAWVKRGNISEGYLFGVEGADTNNRSRLGFNASHVFEFNNRTSSGNVITVNSSAVFRDPSSWYHIVFTFDSTEATQGDRAKLWVNGILTSVTQNVGISLNEESYVNSTFTHNINDNGNTSSYSGFDGYQANIHFIDGQALTPDSFGEVDETYGHWKPIEYTGTYGTNGFYLPFQGTFYNDASGNGNNWTANNLATTDVVLDSPTNNWCTLSSVDFANNSGYLSEGNLKISDTSSSNLTAAGGTFGFTSGKWYFEANLHIQENGCYVGVVKNDQTIPGGTWNYTHVGLFAISGIGTAYVTDGAGSQNSAGTTVAQGDIIQVAYDADTGRIYFGKNGTWLNSADPAAGTGYLETTDNPEEGYRPIASVVGDASGYSDIYMNFGQDSSFSGIETAQNNTDANGYGDFYYSPPSGFLALCTANLPDPAVVPGENFNTVLYAGNGSTQSITGVGFQPDLVWNKKRNTPVRNHMLTDGVRGATKCLSSSLTDAEFTNSGGLTSFDTDGFSVGSYNNFNESAGTYVAWNWKADNTSGSSNTDGSITSTVAANPDAGFSIVSWTGNNTFSNVGHGLSEAPQFVVIKNRADAGTNWVVCNTTTSSVDGYLNLTNTFGNGNDIYFFGDTSTYYPPTSSVFYVGANNQVNGSGDNMIAYCFHSVDGYSKFGSYTGNGSSDGTFVYTGFRPAWVMIKQIDYTNADWSIYDSKRDIDNNVYKILGANSSGAEDSTSFASNGLDFLSNGIKFRGTSTWFNASGYDYIYMAFAEYPFKYTTAR